MQNRIRTSSRQNIVLDIENKNVGADIGEDADISIEEEIADSDDIDEDEIENENEEPIINMHNSVSKKRNHDNASVSTSKEVINVEVNLEGGNDNHTHND